MDIKKLAKRLRDAQASGKSISPLRTEIGIEDIQSAYKIQEINIQHRVENGAFVTGKKIGLTSEVVQKQLGVDQPDFGYLLNDMEVLNGQSLAASTVMQGKVEGEIAFVLGEDLDMEEMSILDVMLAVDFVLPSIEIVGSRIKDWNVKITDTVADNASASHYVLGHTPKTLDEIDLVHIEMNMFINDKVVSSGKGADCLGSPLNAVYWLAKKMIELGDPLREGEVILSGALGPFANFTEGDRVQADFGGLGSVSVNFT